MKRREVREKLVELIYETGFETIGAIGDRTPKQIYANAVEIREFEEDEYLKKVYFGIWQRLDEIDELVASVSENWSSDRISRVSNAIIRLASYEMLYESLPVPVAINEAVELAKKYDTDKAPKFINGILNKIAEKSNLK